MVTFSQQTTTPSASSAIGRSSGPTSATKSSRGGNKKLLPLVVVAAIILVIGGGYYFLRGRGGGIASGEYHAVFLTNDQVYFGKIAKSDSTEVVLKDVFYLLIRQPTEVQAQNPEATPGAQGQQPRYELRHLGDGEAHGPMDEMSINRAQILFIEPLRDDGMVVKGIQQYKEQKAQPQE